MSPVQRKFSKSVAIEKKLWKKCPSSHAHVHQLLAATLLPTVGGRVQDLKYVQYVVSRVVYTMCLLKKSQINQCIWQLLCIDNRPSFFTHPSHNVIFWIKLFPKYIKIYRILYTSLRIHSWTLQLVLIWRPLYNPVALKISMEINFIGLITTSTAMLI